jgi:hypothetical protein
VADLERRFVTNVIHDERLGEITDLELQRSVKDLHDRSYFLGLNAAQGVAGAYPVTLKATVSVTLDSLYLGFSFADALFDIEFIRLFLKFFRMGTSQHNLKPKGKSFC